jgi:hypothetical protein
VSNCIRRYGSQFSVDARHVVVVATLPNQSFTGPKSSVLDVSLWPVYPLQSSWICGNHSNGKIAITESPLRSIGVGRQYCDLHKALNSPLLTAAGHLIDHCLIEKTPSSCSLQFSLPIVLAMIICHIVELICILSILFIDQSALFTLGDAIDSFLQYPDSMTKRICTLSLTDIKDGSLWSEQPEPRRWAYKRHPQCNAAGGWRWGMASIW